MSVVFVCAYDGEWESFIAVHSLVGPAGSSEQFHIHGHVHGLVRARAKHSNTRMNTGKELVGRRKIREWGCESYQNE